MASWNQIAASTASGSANSARCSSRSASSAAMWPSAVIVAIRGSVERRKLRFQAFADQGFVCHLVLNPDEPIPFEQALRKIEFNRASIWTIETAKAACRQWEHVDEYAERGPKPQSAADRSDLALRARRGQRGCRPRSAAGGLPLFDDPEPGKPRGRGDPPSRRAAGASGSRRRHHPPELQGDARRPTRSGARSCASTSRPITTATRPATAS